MALQVSNIVIDCADPQKLADFWTQAIGFELKGVNPHFAFLANPQEGGVNMLLMKVPEERNVKNRVHFDLHTHEDKEAEIARLLALGATRAENHFEFNTDWTVMHDPEGNEFCVVLEK